RWRRTSPDRCCLASALGGDRLDEYYLGAWNFRRQRRIGRRRTQAVEQAAIERGYAARFGDARFDQPAVARDDEAQHHRAALVLPAQIGEVLRELPDHLPEIGVLGTVLLRGLGRVDEGRYRWT